MQIEASFDRVGCRAFALLIRAAPTMRDRLLLEVGYTGGLRVSELVALCWADVVMRAGMYFCRRSSGAPIGQTLGSLDPCLNLVAVRTQGSRKVWPNWRLSGGRLEPCTLARP